MSKSRRGKRREKRGPMPMQSAGLLRFFEEETQGIKIRPELIVILSAALMITVILAHALFPR